MEGRRPASRWATLHGVALTSSLAACIGPNPDFSERPLATTTAATTEPATTEPVTTDASLPEPTTTTVEPAAPDTTGTGEADTTTDALEPATTTTADDTTTTTTSDPGTDTTSPTTGTTSEPGCEQNVHLLAGGRLDVVFVVDRSAAMLAPWDHDRDDLDLDGLHDLDPQLPATPQVPRWTSVHAALTEIATRFDASVRMGLSFFPSQDATMDYGAAACLVTVPIEVGIAPHNASSVVDALPPPEAALAGARPATKAVKAALAALSSVRFPGARKKLVYLTSGDANCAGRSGGAATLLEVHDPTLEPLIADARYGAAILTHVVGVGVPDAINPDIVDREPDGVNPFEQLNALALSGGTAKAGAEKFWAADDDTELLAALDASIRHGLACTVELVREPVLPFSTTVRIGDQDYPIVTDCDGEDGWHFTVEGHYDEIELCGAACAAFQELGTLTTGYYCQAD